MKLFSKYLLTGSVLLIALLIALLKFWSSLNNPWTRDGQVQSNIIQMTPNVSGQVIEVPIKDNQFVHQGDLLFQIDPRPYQAALAGARAQYDKTDDSYLAQEQKVEAAIAQVEESDAAVWQAESRIKELDAEIKKYQAELLRQQHLLPQRATSQRSLESAQAQYDVALEKRRAAQAALAQARASLSGTRSQLKEARAELGQLGEANASIRAARAAVRQAELNLEFTRLVAPVDGYVTDLNLHVGSHAMANQPALAIVSAEDYWIEGYFKETTIARIRPGDDAVVTLMSYPDHPLQGRVESLGWGISQQDGSPGYDLLPNVSPTFEWIRLAQRIPVRIRLKMIPENIALRVGTTCSITVRSGTATVHDGAESSEK